MVDFFSTPLVVTFILGAVGLAIPVIDTFKKERGSNNKLYSAIATGALIITIGYVIYRIFSGEPLPPVPRGTDGRRLEPALVGQLSLRHALQRPA